MAAYLFVLSMLTWVCLIGGLTLVWADFLGRPKWMLCDCRMFPDQLSHLDTPYLLGATIGCAGIAVTDLASLVFEGWDWVRLGFAVFYSLWSRTWYRKWKKHKRGGKHGSLAKLLARVKVTTAGLKVIPVKPS